MIALEKVVRPFQRPTAIQPRRIVASNTKVDVDPAIISWGQAGSVGEAHQIESADDGFSFKVVTSDDKFTEVGRQVDPIRVEQVLPDGTHNPDNYVDLDRPYQVTMKKESETEPKRNSTQTWSTALDTAGFSTVGISNKQSNSKYNFSRNL